MPLSEKKKKWDDLQKLEWGYTGLAALKIAGSLASAISGIVFEPFGGLVASLATSIFTGMLENQLDNAVDGYRMISDSNMTFLVDPSGYVYACVESNRISGAKVTTYWIPYDEDDEAFWDNPDESKSRIWDADEYSQVNPLFTDDNGDYAWDVPEGWWKVVVEKEGYETYTSEWLPVPPPQTEVNVNLVSIMTPEITSATYTDSTITLVFSEYMDPSTITDIVIKDYNDDSVGFTIAYSQDEKDPNGNVFAREYKLIFNGGYQAVNDYFTVTVTGARSYSGIEMSDSIEIGRIPVTTKILGDTDGDGEVTSVDATFVQRVLAFMPTPDIIDEDAGDVDRNGELEIIDATMIQRYIAEFSIPYPIGEPMT